MKKIAKLLGLITGSGIASTFFFSCTGADVYGPAPYRSPEEMDQCCREAASYEKCVQAFEDTGMCQNEAEKSAE